LCPTNGKIESVFRKVRPTGATKVFKILVQHYKVEFNFINY